MTTISSIDSSNIQTALLSARTAACELLQTSRGILSEAPNISAEVAILSPSYHLKQISTLSTLIHSHATRLALTCGPTASSPKATLNCVKDITNPIPHLVAAFHSISQLDSLPGFYVVIIRKQVEELLEVLNSFIKEAINIAIGNEVAESQERLQLAGQIWEVCEQLKTTSEHGPIGHLRKQVRETSEMLSDALEELLDLIDGNIHKDWEEVLGTENDGENEEDIDDEMTEQERNFAEKSREKLKLLQLLYTAILKRRLNSTSLPTANTDAAVLQSIANNTLTLASLVDELVSGISHSEDAEILEILLRGVVEHGMYLAQFSRLDLEGKDDGKEKWFDMWREKMKG